MENSKDQQSEPTQPTPRFIVQPDSENRYILDTQDGTTRTIAQAAELLNRMEAAIDHMRRPPPDGEKDRVELIGALMAPFVKSYEPGEEVAKTLEDGPHELEWPQWQQTMTVSALEIPGKGCLVRGHGMTGETWLPGVNLADLEGKPKATDMPDDPGGLALWVAQDPCRVHEVLSRLAGLEAAAGLVSKADIEGRESAEQWADEYTRSILSGSAWVRKERFDIADGLLRAAAAKELKEGPDSESRIRGTGSTGSEQNGRVASAAEDDMRVLLAVLKLGPRVKGAGETEFCSRMGVVESSIEARGAWMRKPVVDRILEGRDEEIRRLQEFRHKCVSLGNQVVDLRKRLADTEEALRCAEKVAELTPMTALDVATREDIRNPVVRRAILDSASLATRFCEQTNEMVSMLRSDAVHSLGYEPFDPPDDLCDFEPVFARVRSVVSEIGSRLRRAENRLRREDEAATRLERVALRLELASGEKAKEAGAHFERATKL